MEKLKYLLHEVERLSEDERLWLANQLLAIGESGPASEIEQAWDTEIRERIAKYDRGEAKTRSADEVFRDLDIRPGP